MKKNVIHIVFLALIFSSVLILLKLGQPEPMVRMLISLVLMIYVIIMKIKSIKAPKE